MTPEQKAEILRLDQWLAVQDAAGESFTCGHAYMPVVPRTRPATIHRCTMNQYAYEHGFVMAGNLPLDFKRELYIANDASGGDPKAVRAALHLACPFLCETPTPNEVTTHAL